jgi:hypothetical protein
VLDDVFCAVVVLVLLIRMARTLAFSVPRFKGPTDVGDDPPTVTTVGVVGAIAPVAATITAPLLTADEMAATTDWAAALPLDEVVEMVTPPGAVTVPATVASAMDGDPS